MFALIFASLFASPSFAAKSEFACKAIYRTLDQKQDTVERTAEMPITLEAGDLLKREAELEGRHFSLQEEKGELFAQITVAPRYEQGSVVRGSADRQGRFTVSEVNGYTVHRLECQRLQN